MHSTHGNPLRRLLIVLTTLAIVLLFLARMRAELSGSAIVAEKDLQSIAGITVASMQPGDRAATSAVLRELVEHPFIAAATVASKSGRQTERRPATPQSSFLAAMSVRPTTVCAAAGDSTLCLEPDAGAIQRAAIRRNTAFAWIVPLVLLLAVLAWRGRGNGSEQSIAALVARSTREQDYSARVTTPDRAMKPLADSINTLLEQMQNRDLMLRRRTTELEQLNRELEAFSFSVSHDLRAPIGSIDGFSQALGDFYGEKLDDEGREYIRWIRDATQQMQALVESLLQMSRLNQHDLVKSEVDLSSVAQKIAAGLQQRDTTRVVSFHIADGLRTQGDERLLHAVLENMLSNAWKFTAKREEAHIEVGSFDTEETRVYYVRDNGAGFDRTQASRLFSAFQRLHSRSDFDGTGIGLATVKRVIERHGGTVWAEGEVGQGATFYFTTGERLRRNENEQRLSA